jgi:putative DNA primase/helicase
MEDYFDLDDFPHSGEAPRSARRDNDAAGVVWPPQFRIRADGLWFVPGGEKSEVWLSDPFVIEAEARDPGGSGWSLILSWSDRDGRAHRAVIKRADLAGDGTDVRQTLADRGLTLAGGRSCRERFFQALVGAFCSTRRTLSDTTGWREGSFVLAHRTIGPAGHEPVLFHGRGIGTCFKERGSLGEWQEQVARPAGTHHRLAFALAIAFTGPLLEPLGIEGGGFHLFGPSSCGKTTALKVAGSVWGGGGERGFALTWRTTANALEGVAAAHNHTLLALDEIGQISPYDLDQATYALANGQAKARMRADGEIRQRARWRVPILSNGELTIADRIREAGPGKRVRAGQEVRLVDVPADAGMGFGLFDHAGDGGEPAALSQVFQSTTDQFFGLAGPTFVERLLAADTDLIAVARDLVTGIAAKLAHEASDGQVRRVAQRFAVVAAAGELAIELGVLPWAQGTVSAAVQCSFTAWLARRG